MKDAEFEDLRVRTREFIRDIVLPAEPRPGERLDPETRRELMQAAKQAEVFAPHAPRDLGGAGLEIDQWPPILQEAGYSTIGPTVLNCMAPDEGNMYLLERIATAGQKERFLAPLVAGDVRSSFAMTEPHPGAGSDPAALRTTATRVQGGWVINGEKRFISGAEVASFAIVMTRNEEVESHPAGATMLLVDMSDSGVSIGPSIHTIDRAIDGGHPHVTFRDCFVPDDAVLGEPGKGFQYAQVRLGPARLTHCMRWLGLARRALDIALDRTAVRSAFGSRLNDLGLAQGLIADSVIDIEASDALILKSAHQLRIDPKAGAALSSIAKVHCSEAIFRVIDRCIQLTGGDGVSDTLPLAQFQNEVRPFRIYDGPNETHRWAIARRASRARARETQSVTSGSGHTHA